MIDADYDGVAEAGEVRAVNLRTAGRAGGEAAAVTPEKNWLLGCARRSGRPDIQHQAIFAHRPIAELGRDRTERYSLANTSPGFHRLRRQETIATRRVRAIRDSLEGKNAIGDRALDAARRGLHDWRGCFWRGACQGGN